MALTVTVRETASKAQNIKAIYEALAAEDSETAERFRAYADKWPGATTAVLARGYCNLKWT